MQPSVPEKQSKYIVLSMAPGEPRKVIGVNLELEEARKMVSEDRYTRVLVWINSIEGRADEQ